MKSLFWKYEIFARVFGLGFYSDQDDFQHDFAQMTDEADSSADLAELQVAPFKACNNQSVTESIG